MTTETQTIAQFIEQHAVTMTAERVPQNPDMSGDPEWERTAAHHLCTLVRGTATMPVYFSQGSAAFDRARAWPHRQMRPVHFGDRPRCDGCFRAWPCPDILASRAPLAQPKPPELAILLDCIASDAAGYDNARDFDDWCSEYGYDTDSRKAHDTWHKIAEQARRLRGFLGADAYEALLWKVARE